MTSQRGLLIAALTLGALSVVGVSAGGERVSTTAVSNVVSGVWWAAQQNGAPDVPAPAQVPAGGLWVSSTAAGTIAESAVRFTVGPDDRQPILTLPVAMLTTPPKTAAPVDVDVHVLACAADASWSPPPSGSFGPLSDAPKANCDKGQVLGALTSDGKGIEFDLGQFVTSSNRVVSVLVMPQQTPAPVPAAPVALPAAPPPVLVSPTFDVTFNPVTASAIEVLTTAASAADEGTVDAGFDASYNPGAVDFALGAPAVPQRQGFAALPGRVARQVAALTPAAQTAQRTFAAIVFALLCAWAWLVNRDPIPGAAAGRPFRTMYDGAPPVATVKRGFGTAPRVGKPPPLR